MKHHLRMTRLGAMLALTMSGLILTGCQSITEPVESLPVDESVAGSFSGTAATILFKGIGGGIGHGIGEGAFGWVMGALGLADESANEAAQLSLIDDHLQEIIGQLEDIEGDLDDIDSDLLTINCTEWATSLTSEKGRIDNLVSLYETFAATASDGGSVSNATLADWVNQVTAQGSYASHTSMGEILSTFASALMGPANTGVIPSCVQSIQVPDEEALSLDDEYYEKVQLFTDYYFNYQVRALFLFVEAKHYQAWVAAGSPTSVTMTADEIGNVCDDTSASLYCNEAADRTNAVYNAVIEQLTAAGAPFTNDVFVLKYDDDHPYMVPLSLEAFSKAAGDDCDYPLDSADPCGVTAGTYDDFSDLSEIVYGGYTNWTAPSSSFLGKLLHGWTSGTAGEYMESEWGFENMEDKIFISRTTLDIRLDGTNKDITVVGFFDTDQEHEWVSSPFNSHGEFEKLGSRSDSDGGLCFNPSIQTAKSINHVGGSTPDSTYQHPDRRNGFYQFASHARTCGGEFTTDFGFTSDSNWPGWALEVDGDANPNDKPIQYRMPLLEIAKLDCTEGRSALNTAGVWMKCGDDLTAWLDDYITRPETCDMSGTGTSCVLSAASVSRANETFGT